MNALRSARKIRKDAPQCESGNIPCGGICIPRDKKCGGKEKVKGVLKRVGRKLERVAVKAGDRLKEHLEDELEIHNRTKKENDEVDRVVAVKKLGGMAATALATSRPSESDAVDKAGEYVKEKNAQRIRSEYKKEKEAKKMKKDSLDPEVAKSVAQIIADSFDAPVQSITSLMDSGDRIVGTCISGGNFYRFDSDNVFIEVEHLPKETQEIHDYTRGILDSLGVRVDSDRPYDWLMGFVRMDAQVKCKSGGTPCGKRCLPKGQKCKISGGGAGLKSPKTGLKMPGAGAAGLAAAALAATGAGVVGYRGRKEIGEGIKNAKDEVKRGVEEAKENMRDVETKKYNAEEVKKYASNVRSAHDMAKQQYARLEESIAENEKRHPNSKVAKWANETSRKMVEPTMKAYESMRQGAEEAEKEYGEIGRKAGSKTESAKMIAKGVGKGTKKLASGLRKGIKKGVTGKA